MLEEKPLNMKMEANWEKSQKKREYLQNSKELLPNKQTKERELKFQ